MDIFKIKLYAEILQISILLAMTFYVIPLDLLLGEYQDAVRRLIFQTLFWVLAWKFNGTLHVLMEKWGKK